MKKLLWALLIIILVGLVGAWIVYMRLPGLISSHLTEKAKVDVRISDVQITKKSIELDHLTMSNPQGSKLSYALKVQDIDIKAPLTTYVKDPIIIDQVLLDNVYIGLEFYKAGSTNGNWTYIVNNLNQGSDSDKAGTEVVMKKVTLRNINVDLYTHQSGAKVKSLRPIKQMEFTNVTSSGGIPAAQLTNAIMKITLREIFSREGIQNMLEGALNPKNSLNPLKNLFSDNEENPKAEEFSSLN